MDWLSTEQILYSNFSDLLAQFRVLDKLSQTRHHCGRNRNEQPLDGVLPHQSPEGFSRSYYPLATQHEPNFAWIVIDNAYDIAHQGLVPL
jgi:hypothetical protein